MKTLTFILFATLPLLPCHAQSYEELCKNGKEYLEKKNYRKAAEQFHRAASTTAKEEEKIYALTNQGYAWRQCGELKRAGESYAKALDIDTTSAPLLIQRGNILLELDSAKAAIGCYEKALAKQPHNKDIIRLKAYAHTQAEQYAEGKKAYIKLISMDNNDRDARLGLAMLYEKEGSTNESLMMLEALIEEHPHAPEYYIVRSKLERAQKQPELALQDVDKAIELAPHNSNYHILRAELLTELGRYDAAERARKKAIKLMHTPKE